MTRIKTITPLTREPKGWGSPGALVLGFAICAVAGLAPAQTFTTIHQFRGMPNDGAHPGQGGSLIGDAGSLIGTTANGGTANTGTVFSLSPPAAPGQPWAETILHSFTAGPDGRNPGAVVLGSGGIVYGTTFKGGTYGYGTAFSLTPPTTTGGAWSHTVIYNFNNRQDPSGPLAIDTNGVIYGTSEQGGPVNLGTVFSLTPPSSQGGAWTESTLYSFNGTDGGEPTGVVIGAGGVLYGSAGITSAEGVVFSLTPPSSQGGDWTYDVIASVTGQPAATVVIGAGGVLYGTTYDAPPSGSVFSVTPPSSPGGAWTVATLYLFQGGPENGDGAQPMAPLVVGQGGVLYGVTAYGGYEFSNDGSGTIFSLAPPTSQGGAWTETQLYRFTDGADGSFPGCVILSKQGTLFGVADEGPRGSGGTVWEFNP